MVCAQAERANEGPWFGGGMLAGMRMQPAGEDAAAPDGCRDGDGVAALIRHVPAHTSMEVQ